MKIQKAQHDDPNQIHTKPKIVYIFVLLLFPSIQAHSRYFFEYHFNVKEESVWSLTANW